MARGPAIPERIRISRGITLNVRVWPGLTPGPTVLLLHPNRTNSHVWDFVVAHSRLPNRFVAVDHRGHGDSDWPEHGYELDDYVEDDIALIEEQLDGPVVLVGAATGGNIALLLASRRPDLVLATIVVDPGLSLDPAINERVQDEIESGYSYADRAMALAAMPFSDLWSPHVRAHYGHHGFRDLEGGGVAGRYDKDAAQYTEALLEVDMWDRIDLRSPLLAVRGAESEVFDRQKLVRLGDMVAGSTIAEVVRANHRVTQDNPAVFAALMDAFVESVLSDRPLA
jgi:3-oxoadipate enol-lactonase